MLKMSFIVFSSMQKDGLTLKFELAVAPTHSKSIHEVFLIFTVQSKRESYCVTFLHPSEKTIVLLVNRSEVFFSF